MASISISEQPIKFISYNCTGVKNNIDYVNKLAGTADILFIQEHWLYSDDINFLSNLNVDSHFHATCGMPDEKSIMHGRPFGGTAIIWKK